MSHSNIVRDDEPQQAQGDKKPGPDTRPIHETCCAPDDFSRMVQFALERRRRDHIDEEGLHEAADRALGAIQGKLRELEGSVLAWADAMDLYAAGRDAIGALMHAYPGANPHAYAKQRQLAHSNDRPLAVCVGGGKRRPVKTVLGWTEAQARGCLRVFEDSTQTSGRSMWARLCPDCRPSKGQSLRRAESALRHRAKEIRHIRYIGG